MKIRILVAVDSAGAWEAQGGSDGNDEDHFSTLHEWAVHCATGATRFAWIEAEVPAGAVEIIRASGVHPVNDE